MSKSIGKQTGVQMRCQDLVENLSLVRGNLITLEKESVFYNSDSTI